MKHLFFAFFISLVVATSGFGQTIAELPVKLGYDRYATAQLDDARELIVTTHDIQNQNLFQADVLTGEKIVLPLSEAVYTKLLQSAIRLSDADVKVHRQDIVCM